MTSKRMKKLYMSQGVSRDAAEFISKHIRMHDANGRPYSHAEMYKNVTVEVDKNGKRGGNK